MSRNMNLNSVCRRGEQLGIKDVRFDVGDEFGSADGEELGSVVGEAVGALEGTAAELEDGAAAAGMDDGIQVATLLGSAEGSQVG